MDNYWREQILEIIKAIRYGMNQLDNALMDTDTIKILLKNIKVVMGQDEKYRDAIEVIDSFFVKLDEKAINVNGILSDLEILEDIVKREIE